MTPHVRSNMTTSPEPALLATVALSRGSAHGRQQHHQLVVELFCVHSIGWIEGALSSTRFKNQGSGVPNRATAATCGATSAGMGPLMSGGRMNPGGTEENVV